MGKISISYKIYEKWRQSDGRYPIKLQFIYNRQPALFATNLFASEYDLFPAKKEEISKSRIIKNVTLRRKVEDMIREYEDASNDFDPYLFPDWKVSDVAKYLDKIVHKESFRLDFPTFCKQFIAEKEKTSHQAALNYKASLNALCVYIGKERFDVSTITSAKMREFEEFLRNKFGTNARAVSLYTSGIATIHKAARRKYNSEELNEILIKNPFDYYTPPKQPVAKHRDVEPEIIQGMIRNYPSLRGQERLAIGTFLLSFTLLGMNTPDIYECARPKDGILHYFRHKTKMRRADNAEMKVRIPECIKPLIDEYSDKTRKRAFNFHLRYSSYKNMQDAQKDGMAKYRKRIGYTGSLTNYSARHSWATIARSGKCNIPLPIIDDCLNHVSKYPMGDIYAKRDFSILWEANEKVLELFEWRTL